MKIVTIVGARPQFVKAAAVSRAIITYNEKRLPAADWHPITEVMVHTGQHYDDSMSQVFFDELKIPIPAVNLEIGSGRHGQQTGQMLQGIEQVLLDEHPDWVLIYGDTNSTLAGALAAAKLNIPVIHVEAGLRSFNRRMPEEINRLVADQLATLLFCPTGTAVTNLGNEGITRGVYFVGDVMYDSVQFYTELSSAHSTIIDRLGLSDPVKGYYLATVHRAENTDDLNRLKSILEAFSRLDYLVVWPIHPRTRHILGVQLNNLGKNIRIIEPVGYLDMLALQKNARLILTDSGGIQKEAFWMDVPCVTLRDETEWVELVALGVNRLVGCNSDAIISAVSFFETAGLVMTGANGSNVYGDGRSAEHIVDIITGQQ